MVAFLRRVRPLVLRDEPIDKAPANPARAAFPGMLARLDPDTQPVAFPCSGRFDAQRRHGTAFLALAKLELAGVWTGPGSPFDHIPCIAQDERWSPGKPCLASLDFLLIEDSILRALAGAGLFPFLAVQAEHGSVGRGPDAAADIHFDCFARLNALDLAIPPAGPSAIGVRCRLEMKGAAVLVDALHADRTTGKIAAYLQRPWPIGCHDACHETEPGNGQLKANTVTHR